VEHGGRGPGLERAEDMLAIYNNVTVDDVNRVLRTYVDNDKAVAAYAVPRISAP